MTDKVKKLLEDLNSKEYRKQRSKVGEQTFGDLSVRDVYMREFRRIVDLEAPLLFENDDFGFNMAIDCILPIVNDKGNVTPDYYTVISQGFDAVKERIKNSNGKNKSYGNAMIESMDICTEFSDKYRDYAKKCGNERLYNALCNIPRKGAQSFYEACVFIKMCIFFMRHSFVNHIGLGRFDQYMYPFYLKDKEKGITDDEILETIEEFFISINRDTDIYVGIQQGDNGQSIMLGGFDRDGNSMYNELSKMCIQASLDLNLIDPKINLRVGKSTPDEIYEYATLLTKQGMGFPQYCNDDVVIPGLLKLGYDLEDALDYTVAACWEFIIPGKGAEVPNAGTFDFPATVNRAITKNIKDCDTFEKLMSCVKDEVDAECNNVIETLRNLSPVDIPFLSIFFKGCIESLTDMWRGGTKYKNYGCHGTGIANAADALAAVKKNVFDEKNVDADTLLMALNRNFDGYAELRNILLNSPKMGNNDNYVDSIACDIMDMFSDSMNKSDNGIGGIWRAGTGSAMEYLWKGEKCPATADGRKAYEPYSSSFSPAIGVKTNGILSVLQSFTKYDLTKIVNGGPLTIEIHDTVLRNDEGIKKVAMLVKNYILLGGHQLQLNSVNRERLLDAQKHPENYPNLIVRVWGWSGYFNELDMAYQNHIISRTEFM